MELILGTLLVLFVIGGGLLLSDYVYRMGGTMEERKAVVFEVYRYSVCFVMVIVFGMMAFQMILALLTDANNIQALAGPGLGALLSGLLFVIHWIMKAPGGKSQASNH